MANVELVLRALQSAQQHLERQLATDNLKKGLAHRPEREELVERMLLYVSTIIHSIWLSFTLASPT